jgi:hypothetical protein
MGQDDTTVTISSSASSEHQLQEQKLPIRQRFIQGTYRWATRFFPWAGTHEVRLQDVTKAQYVPWLGLLALAGSGLTVLLSWVVLIRFDGHVAKETSHFKPAGWLSVILSANSVLLHVALSGLFHACRNSRYELTAM